MSGLANLSEQHDDRTVCQGLGEEEAKVSLVMRGTKGIIDCGSHYGIDTREGGVQHRQPQAVAELGGQTVHT